MPLILFAELWLILLSATGVKQAYRAVDEKSKKLKLNYAKTKGKLPREHHLIFFKSNLSLDLLLGDFPAT